jgi:hypothetical protein
VSATPGVARHLEQPLLRAMERPPRRHQPAVLRRVAVAEHDHLAALAEMAAIERVGEQLAHHLRRRLQVAHGLEQRADLEVRVDIALDARALGAALVAALGVTRRRPAIEREHAQQVIGAVRHADDERPDRVRAEAAAALAQDAEDVEDAGDRGVTRRHRAGLPSIGRDRLELRPQPRRSLRRRPSLPPRIADQPGDHLAMHARVLPHVERRQVEAEGADASRQPAHPEQAGARTVVAHEAGRDQLEIGEQLLGLA